MKTLLLLIFFRLASAREADSLDNFLEEEFDDIIAECNVKEFALGRTRKLLSPSCHHEGSHVACCLEVGIKKGKYKTCVELSFVSSEMKAIAALDFNNKKIISRDVEVGKMCHPLPPPLSMLQGCLNMYYAQVNLDKKYVNACFVFEITHFLQIRFDCFRLDKGKFQHHSDNPPERHGLINVGFANGKPFFRINKPKWINKVGKLFG